MGANKNTAEFIAEAFREYTNSPKPRRVAQRVGEIIDEHMNADWDKDIWEKAKSVKL